LLLFIFRKKSYIYLRSNGYEEYRAILGFFGSMVYHFMYSIVTFYSKVIVCQSKLAKKENIFLVFPSQIDKSWLINNKTPNMDKPRLLYVGRIKVEKGIFSFLKIFEELNIDSELSIVGNSLNFKTSKKNINFLGYINDVDSLIDVYDNHNIFVLPSFTEAHPQVLYESLARLRPVIIFDDIKYVIKDQKGIFVSKRNTKAFLDTVKLVMKDYKNIQESMKKNKLPKKSDFIEQMFKILN